MTIQVGNNHNISGEVFKDLTPKKTQEISTQTAPIPADSVNIGKKSGKVGLGEAVGLIAKGFKDKVVNIVKTIVQHPIKTISTMALTTAGLLALPFIGISVASGGAALAVIFALMALCGTTKTSLSILKNELQGNHDKVREGCYKLGGCGVDLALTLPFLPKATKQIIVNLNGSKNLSTLELIKDSSGKVTSETTTYWGGTKTTKFNPDGTVASVTKKSLYQSIKEAKTWKDKFRTLFRQDREELLFSKLDKAYIQTAKERGFRAPRHISMTSRPMEHSIAENVQNTKMTYGFVSRKEPDVVHLNRLLLKTKTNLKDLIETIGHEHRHVEQHSIMARTEGLKTPYDKSFSLKMHKDGVIKQGTKEAAFAQKLYDATKNYSTKGEAYTNNLLEVDAREIGEKTIADAIYAKLKNLVSINNENKIVLKYNPAMDLASSNAMVINHKSKVKS